MFEKENVKKKRPKIQSNIYKAEGDLTEATMTEEVVAGWKQSRMLIFCQNEAVICKRGI